MNLSKVYIFLSREWKKTTDDCVWKSPGMVEGVSFVGASHLISIITHPNVWVKTLISSIVYLGEHYILNYNNKLFYKYKNKD